MRIRPVTVGGALAAITVGLTTFLSITPASAAPVPAKPGDFNGDGHRDVAIGSPHGDVGSVKNTGFVTVVYGGSTGPDATKRQVVSQSSSGIPGGSEEYDAFGSALASADFDRDGYADLAIGAAGEDSGGAPLDGGRVTIVYGGSGGLSSRAIEFTKGGRFGASLAAGDFDGNGAPDLAVGAFGDLWVYRGLATGDLTGTKFHIGSSDGESAHVAMAAADYTGDGVSDLAISLGWSSISPDSDGFNRLNVYKGSATGLVPEPMSSEDRGYADLTAGDVNGDGKADLVGGWGNMILVMPATENGFGAAQVINQDTDGVPGTGEPEDNFGDELAAGDVNGDGKADVAIGAPGEAIGTVTGAGAVTVLYGSGDGLTATGAQMLGQNSAGVPGGAEQYDSFGDGLSLADTDGDGKADLTAGAPGEDGGEGAIWLLRGSATGVTVSGATILSTSALGVSGRHAGLGGVLLP